MIRLGAFASVLAAASLAATWVGLSGSWVSDDWHMVNNYLYGDWAELGAVFQRNAGYYLFAEGKPGPYRPITMLTLLGTHLVVAAPWLHHAVSWSLHATTSLLVFVVLVQQLRPVLDDEARVRVVSAILATLFFVHPAQVEAYVWINGRSDLLAGFWLVALAFFLQREDPSSRARVDAVIVGVLAFLGAGSKLPFVPAAVAVWFAWALRGDSSRRGLYGSAIVLALAGHAALRAVFAPFGGTLGDGRDVLFDPQVWLALPKLFARGAVSWLTFRAEAMQSLSWVLFGPWTALDVAGLILVLLCAVFLARRRDWPGVAYFAGALATLAPVIVVSRSFWMGFDRYLYMPSLLLLWSVAPHVLLGTRRLRTSSLAMVAAVGVVLALFQTHRASRAYASQEAQEEALLRDHPEDPTVHYYFARAADRAADQEALRSALSTMPPPPWPRPIIVPTYELAIKASDSERAMEAIDALVDMGADVDACETTQAQLVRWRARSPDTTVTRALDEALSRLPCGS